MSIPRSMVDPGRPKVDNPPIGGDKNEKLSSITPFVAVGLSRVSPEDMKVDIETQFRQVADVTRDMLITIESLKKELSDLKTVMNLND